MLGQVSGDDDPRAARRIADQALVVRLRASNFEGPDYEEFEFELVRRTHQKIVEWIRNDRAFQLSSQQGRRIPVEPRHRQLLLAPDAHEAKALANEAIARTLDRFRRDALLGGGWDPEKGASLYEYFCRAVIQSLPNAYAQWSRGHPVDGREEHRPATDPAHIYREAASADQLLARLGDAEDRVIAKMAAAGYSQREIAQQLGRTPRSIEVAMRRIRRTLRQHGYGGRRNK